MENKNNLTCYDNVEVLQYDLPEDELKKYLQLKLSTTQNNVDFILSHFNSDKKVDIIEVGGGQW